MFEGFVGTYSINAVRMYLTSTPLSEEAFFKLNFALQRTYISARDNASAIASYKLGYDSFLGQPLSLLSVHSRHTDSLWEAS